MTDKQQIEVLTKITCDMYRRNYDKKCAGVQECDMKCLQYQRCEALYNIGYRRIGEDEIVVKADKYKRLVSILKNLKALAHDVDDYRDDIIADYRNMAETHMDWIIEELLNLNEEELL